MITIRRENQPPEHYVCVPLDPVKAAKVLKRAFNPSQLAEIVRRLHGVDEPESPEPPR